MKTKLPIALFLCLSLLHCHNRPAPSPPTAPKSQLPGFSLKDPHGKTYTAQKLAEKNLIIVATAPTLQNKSAQEGWSKQLESHSKDITVVFLEDMAACTFKNQALKSMKKECKPGEEPFLLLDPDGETRKSLQVPADKTVVLVYQKGGRLVHSETAAPSRESAARIWRALRK